MIYNEGFKYSLIKKKKLVKRKICFNTKEEEEEAEEANIDYWYQ